MNLKLAFKLFCLLLLCFNYGQAVCGNGILEVGEECDGRNADPGCSSSCTVYFDYLCSYTLGALSVCSKLSCGDLKVHTAAYCNGLPQGA